MKLLNNLFGVGWNTKNADTIWYLLMSLVSLQQENVNKIDKSMKIVNSEGKNLHIFWTTWGISMKDVAFDQIKSKKKSENDREGGQIDLLPVF